MKLKEDMLLEKPIMTPLKKLLTLLPNLSSSITQVPSKKAILPSLIAILLTLPVNLRNSKPKSIAEPELSNKKTLIPLKMVIQLMSS